MSARAARIAALSGLGALALATLTPSTVRADESTSTEAEGFHFGVIPGFRYARHSFDLPVPVGPGRRTYDGGSVEVDGTFVLTIPGDRFAVGATLGLINTSGKNGDEQQSYFGYQYGAVAMVSIIAPLFLQARMQWVRATMANDASVSGLRYGGGATVIVSRSRHFDAALQLDYLLTPITIDGPTPIESKGSTVLFGLLFAMVD